MWKDTYKDCLTYIDHYWDKIIHEPSHMPIHGRLTRHIPLLRTKETENYDMVKIPYAYIVPNDRKFNYIFYWDTFFMSKGILGTKHEKIMKEMIKNFMYLFHKYGIIPNFNAPVSLGRSQPPFLTSMILDTFLRKNERKGKRGESKNSLRERIFSRYSSPTDRYWFKKAIEVAKEEYELVWIDKRNAYNHHVSGFNLSRYGDRDVGYAHSSELESGWDFTSRFYNQCNHYLPIDLNTYLYRYERDFAYVAQLQSDYEEHKKWQKKADARKTEINQLMWNEKEGFYFDYNWFHKSKSNFLSLAGFVPMWAGLATYDQARKMVKKLAKFETRYGLTITAEESLAKQVSVTNIQDTYREAVEDILRPKQWDYPNIWSPLEYLCTIGLLRYGFIEEAKRIMTNSVHAHAALFRKYGTFFEKINANTGEPGINFHYENQPGFGWTNAAFYRYIQILDELDSGHSIYSQPQRQHPPFDLAIIH